MSNVIKLPTWAERKAAGDAHENRVRDELRLRGWTVDTIGQGAMSEPVTEVLRRSKSLLRFLPEFIAVRAGELVLIDCKGRMAYSRRTNRNSISRACVEAHIHMWSLFGHPIYYVFDSLGVMTPFEVKRYADTSVGRSGSYYLVPAAEARPFEATFGGQEPGGQLALLPAA